MVVSKYMKTFLLALVGLIIIGGAAVWFTRDEAGSPPPTKGEVVTPITSETSTLVPKTVTFADKSEATFRLQKEFNISVAAEGLGKARFMAWSPDGRLFIADMVNWNLSHKGRILILEDFDATSKRFNKQSVYLTDQRGPNGLAFYTDSEGKTWVYVALTEALYRYPYTAGDTRPSGGRQTVATFPNKQSPGADGIVWHVTRSIVFKGDRLYVSVGSGCNLCEQPESELRAVVLSMDPDGKNVETYVSGFKNAVGIEFAGDTLYATENGVDHLGGEKPDDGMYRLEKGKNYGWPYCYELGGVKYDDAGRVWQRKSVDCADVPKYFVSFGPHAAPLGLMYFEGGNALLDKTFLVALHGSHDPKLEQGYAVVRVTLDGKQEIFMDGFIDSSGKRPARPVAFLKKDENSFFLSDDHGGRIFYIYSKSN